MIERAVHRNFSLKESGNDIGMLTREGPPVYGWNGRWRRRWLWTEE
jgi:hypothetical protein